VALPPPGVQRIASSKGFDSSALASAGTVVAMTLDARRDKTDVDAALSGQQCQQLLTWRPAPVG
jgi:hypothetical protein